MSLHVSRLRFLGPEGNYAPDNQPLLVPNAAGAEHVACMKAEIWSEIPNGRDHFRDIDIVRRVG
jgi:hypothetical protein